MFNIKTRANVDTIFQKPMVVTEELEYKEKVNKDNIDTIQMDK